MPIFIPVVKDTYYETTLDTLDYKILLDGFTVFEGRAVKGPEGNLSINVNRIFKDYIENRITDFREVDGGIITHPEAFRIFELRDSSDTLLATYGVLFDWGREWDGQAALLSDPVRPSISQQMKFPISIYSPEGQTETIDFAPIVTNTYFNLLQDSIIVPNRGGSFELKWETDFYPASDIIPSASTADVTFSNQTSTGVTVTVPKSPLPGSDRDFTITFTYNGRKIGEATVVQTKVQFTLITKTLTVASSGGTVNIQWTTDMNPTNISISAPSWPGTRPTGLWSTGATISIPSNTSYDDYDFVIDYNYYYDNSGVPYYLDSTQVTIKGKAGATSGDTGTTTGVTIETGVTRDLVFTADKAFAGITQPSIQVWYPGFYKIKQSYYPVSTPGLYENALGSNITWVTELNSNIPLCSRSTICPTYNPIIDFDGYTLSGSTQWLNDLLIAAKEDICRNDRPLSRQETYYGNEPRVGTLYLKSGSTVLCENTVIQLPAEEGSTSYPWLEEDDNLGTVFLKTISPFTFSDFKYKTTSFDETSAIYFLQRVIPVWNAFKIYDGVYKVLQAGVFKQAGQANINRYSASAFDLEYDSATGWVTVKTPLPIYEIAATSGLFATEIWISRNVKCIVGTSDTTLTAVTYAGTVQDFRNVISKFNTSKLSTVQCSDGVAYSDGYQYNKSDPIRYIGNQIRPSLCDEYFYETDEPTIGNSITITFTGSTVDRIQINDLAIGRSGRKIAPVTTTEGTSGDYATLTLTYDEEVIGITLLRGSYRQVSDNILYYYSLSSGVGTNIAVPSVKMRSMEGYVYSDNNSLPSVYENNNLKFVKGYDNFKESSVKVLKAPNLISLDGGGFNNSYIEEFYIPSIQYIGKDVFPSTTTKVTVGKNLSYCDISAFSKATNLTSLYYNGSVEEWEKQVEYCDDLKEAFEYGSYNITTVYCDNGEWSPQ